MTRRAKNLVRLQPYFGFRNETRLRISARALRAGSTNFEAGGRWQALRTMVAQFASREVAGLTVTLNVTSPDGQALTFQHTTNPEGFVHFDIELPDWSMPEQSQWEPATLQWNADGQPKSAEGHVLAPGAQSDLGVISDIDDTIIETGITGNIRAVLRNWKRVLAQMPAQRIAVPGVDLFYGALGGAANQNSHTESRLSQPVTITPRPFFYVSSSPWNLYSYLVAFQKLRKLPLGPIALRDWGLNKATFGGSSHGAHKVQAIERILQTYPKMRFALIGDDSQGDLTAYGSITQSFPEQIAAVFIRKTGPAFSQEELAAKATIKAAGVPLWLGDDYATGEAFLKQTKLLGDDDASQIVHAKTSEAAAESAGENS